MMIIVTSCCCGVDGDSKPEACYPAPGPAVRGGPGDDNLDDHHDDCDDGDDGDGDDGDDDGGDDGNPAPGPAV